MPTPCPQWHKPESEAQLASVVQGMNVVTRFILKRAGDLVIDHGQLRDWHGTVFSHVVPLSYYAGNYRSANPARPCLAQQVHIGPYTGLDYHLVSAEMRKFSGQMRTYIAQTDAYLRRAPSVMNKTASCLQLAAWTVGRFIQVHPFLNGNGRISRLLANYMFVRYGLGLAHFDILPRPAGDYSAVMQGCMTGDFSGLYQYFVLLLASQTA